MKTNWTPRKPLTQDELNTLVASVHLRSTPEDPCAKYSQVLKMQSIYRAKFGEGQLYKDYKLAQERLGDKSGNRKD